MGAKKTVREARSFLLLVILTVANIPAHADDFNVKSNGATGDGKSDDSKAITSSWKQACDSTNPSKLIIPQGTYVVGPVTFAGPCKASPITIQLQGTLQAPEDVNLFKSQESWVIFQSINALSLSGGGTFNGQGSQAWQKNDCAKTGKCHSLPNNLAFTGVTNSTIEDITSKDSKLFHMNIINCKNVTFNKVTIDAPGESLNTDGIHIGRSNGITITGANIKTGDDCVSLGDGSEQVTVEGVTCGPGHGISIGSLGRYQNEQPVTGVTVRNCTFTNTMNGVRVKTWPGSPSGVASDLHFESLIMNNVSTAVLIDQEYCPYNQCQQEVPSKVKISNVSFKGITGTTSADVPIRLVCSKGVPCEKVDMKDINLKYEGKDGKKMTSQCSNVQPTKSGSLSPDICP